MSSRSSTKRPEAAALPETVVVGLVRKPHGVHGELVVEPLSDVAARFAPGAELLLVTAGDTRPVVVETSRPHARALLVKLAGHDDRDAAERLRGAALAVPRRQTPPAPAGSFYHFELVGCVCRDRTLGELGRVVGLLEDGGGLLLRVAGPARELLLPFAAVYLVEVDVPGRRIELDLPAGLVETCASPS